MWSTALTGSGFGGGNKDPAGYAVVTLHSAIEAMPLPRGTSVQNPELIALTHALQLAAGGCANIYTASKYAFTTLHVHGALYKERV